MTLREVSPQDAFDRLKPENCAFVLTVAPDGKPTGMIASWITKCSMKPPLFAVALSKTGYTHKLLSAAKEFVIVIPNKSLEPAVEVFGSTHGDEVDKFKVTGVETKPAKYVRPPLLADATMNLECLLVHEFPVGDRSFFIGEVVAAHLSPSKKVLAYMRKSVGRRIFREF